MTEREAIIRLEVIRIKSLKIRPSLEAPSEEDRMPAWREWMALQRERVAIVDSLGLGSEIERQLRTVRA